MLIARSRGFLKAQGLCSARGLQAVVVALVLGGVAARVLLRQGRVVHGRQS